MYSLVTLVDKAIYSTMDSGYNWWKVLDGDMGRLDYRKSCADQSVHIRDSDGEITITSTYTDNITRMSSTRASTDLTKRELGEKYKVKNLGDLKLVLGI